MSSSEANGPGAAAPMTHVAIRTREMDASMDFYRRYAGYFVTHERVDDGIRVVWMAPEPDDPDFVLVLLEMPHERVRQPAANDHYGFAVGSRKEVDRIGALAEREDLLRYGPAEGGPIVGYFVMVRDPSGNVCEFSFGQPIRTKDLPNQD